MYTLPAKFLNEILCCRHEKPDKTKQTTAKDPCPLNDFLDNSTDTGGGTGLTNPDKVSDSCLEYYVSTSPEISGYRICL